MKLLALCAAGIGLMLCASCTNNKHLISDEAERAAVQQDFEARRDTLTQGNLFQVFEQPMSDEQKEAMTFLYAYMPLADIADHPGEFYLENVDYAFKAREEMPWGKVVPEREFRHFVLPIRVNNENLDDSRKVFYEELKDRVKNLSLYDAVLEVNHWCHEKVIYTPSDARTSSPLASVKTAYGRCGEEIYVHGSRLAFGRHPCPPGIYAALGTYRRQSCLGGSLGRWQMVLPGCLRARTGTESGMGQRSRFTGYADAHQGVRTL